MTSLKYKRQWLAKERIAKALKDGTLISWYRSNQHYVVNVKRT